MIRKTLTADGIVDVRVTGGELIITGGFPASPSKHVLPVITSDIQHLFIPSRHGSISFEAMAWLNDVGINWTALYDGRPTGHGYNNKSDALLRRSQARAADCEYGAEITRYLLTLKLAGQRDVADDLDARASREISTQLDRLVPADLVTCRKVEARAALVYFKAWSGRVAMKWDEPVPDAWQTFTSRESEISPTKKRNATDPVNALLNYGYGVLEGRTVAACHEMGLDPDMGILHADETYRPSMVSDLMEPGRPMVDRLLLDWISSRSFKKREFVQSSQSRTVRLTPPISRHVASLVSDAVGELYPYWEDVLDILVQNQTRWDKRGKKRRTPLSGDNYKARYLQ